MNKKNAFPKKWAEFCKQTGRDPKALPDVSMYDEREQRRQIAGFKLPLVIKHCNGGDPDYTDTTQWKYEPWWKVKADKKRPSGFGLSFLGFDFWNTHTGCGPRFAFLSVPACEHVTRHFIKDYEDYYLP